MCGAAGSAGAAHARLHDAPEAAVRGVLGARAHEEVALVARLGELKFRRLGEGEGGELLLVARLLQALHAVL